MTYRVARMPRWTTIHWSGVPDADFRWHLSACEPIAGVRLHPQAVDVPYTAWELPEVERLFEAAGHKTPQVEELPYTPAPEVARPLFPHQLSGARAALRAGGIVLADTMGLGKTSTAAAAAGAFLDAHGGPQGRVLILAPLFTRSTWARELVALGLIRHVDELCVLVGRDSRASCWRDDARWYFAHYDVIAEWFPRFGLVRPTVTIADEAHYIRNPKAARSEGAAAAIGPAKLRILLTGTPIENRGSDLWQLLSVATGRGTWGTQLAFRQRYCGAYRADFGWVDSGPTNVEELHLRIERFYLRRTQEDAGIVLPDLTRQRVEVAMDEADVAAHDSVDRKLHAATGLSLEEALEQLLFGRGLPDQNGIVFQAIGEARKVTSRAKLPSTVELVRSIVEQGESAVVFVWERAMAQKIARKLPGTVHVIDGSVPEPERAAMIDRFQAEGGVIVATYGALKEGVTLHRARAVVHHDLDWSPSTMAQAEKRIHRIGQHQACTAYWMTASSSIDVMLAQALLRKLDVNQGLLGIDYGTREMVEPLLPKGEQIEQSLAAWRDSKW